MPDPNAKYPGLNRKEGVISNPISFLDAIKRGNKQGQDLINGNTLKRVTAARNRTAQKASGGGSGGGGLDDITQLENMLTQFGGMGAPDLSSLKAELQKAISSQYNPQITNLQNEMGQAKKRAAGAKRDLGALYGDLANYYTGQLEPTKKRGESYKKEAKQSGDALKQSITDDYAQRLREQVDMYKQLGIEAAAPSATEGQMADQANQMAVADNTSTAEQAALTQEEAADMAYWSEGAGIAKNEGADQQAMLEQQLQDYLNKQSGQVALLKGQKDAAYHQAVFNLQQQAAESASKQQNELWNRMLELAKLKMSMANASGGGGGSGSVPTKGLLGATSFLGDQRLSDFFQKSISEGAVWGNSAQGRQYYGGQPPNSPEEWAQVIRDNAANKGLSASDQARLWQAALIYYGRLR